MSPTMWARRVLGGLAVGALAVAATGVEAARAGAAQAEPTFTHTWRGDQSGERFGFAVSELSDIDGDGAREAIIGAPFHRDAAGTAAGHTDVVSGRTGALLYRFEGEAEDRHGYAMADAGDVDADGVADIVVGATGVSALACSDVPRTGRAYVYSGADGALLLRVGGEAAGDQFGAAVAAAGDVDRDGRADLLIGAPCHDGRYGADAGRAYVVSGRTGGVLRVHDGRAAGDGFGWGTGALGDVTGDRRPDYVIGAKDAGPGDRGLAYVYDGRHGWLRHTLAGNRQSAEFGWFFVASAGDVDRDGRNDVYVGDFCADDAAGGCSTPLGQAYVFSGHTGRLLHLFRGEQPGDGAGPGRSAGDVDRDGHADVVVGLYASSAAAPQAGRVIVYSGRTGRKLFDYASQNAGETLGYDAVGLGDVNGDGRIELLLSAAVGDVVYLVST
ncbi:FG-GAP-like repeat-containing protein [Micromonospora sp. CPCC 205371]|nr:FG-GAP-like repeat-containing protein [Micromonospora sp. CPCC 205371]